MQAQLSSQAAAFCQPGRCSTPSGTLQLVPAAARCQRQLRQQRIGLGPRLTMAVSRAVPEAAVELAPTEQEQWVACSQLVQQRSGLEAEEADAALLKAFGWKGQGFWRQERMKQVPDQDQVTAALDYLAQLGIAAPADVGALVKAFPEALGLQVALMEENVRVLRDKWYMKGNVLVNAIKRKPRVLGNCIDCEGNCAGLCTRCWAQF